MKQALRRELRTRRLRLSARQRRVAANQAARRALRLLRESRARRIAIYLDTGSEMATAPLLQLLATHQIRIAVPRIVGDGVMHFEWLEENTPLRRNRHGIHEPAARGKRARRADFDAIIVPLIGFDAHGNRLGAGGGYYDRWLARPRIAHRPRYLGYAYALQQVQQLPHDAWDVRLDAVITERGITWGVAWPIG
ncbi:MAG TPA: 5-formyltetrahydrofolate cyclo-ligase [Solimonas sp.]